VREAAIKPKDAKAPIANCFNVLRERYTFQEVMLPEVLLPEVLLPEVLLPEHVRQ
jgi:hypothetical protein